MDKGQKALHVEHDKLAESKNLQAIKEQKSRDQTNVVCGRGRRRIILDAGQWTFSHVLLRK